MIFSSQQEEALSMISDWLGENQQQVFSLFGYAGTGKTTLAQHIKADFYAAYTGKAAHVLKQKGCKNACTIHSLIYTTYNKSKKRLAEMEQKRVAGVKDHALEMEIARELRNIQQPSFHLNFDSPLQHAELIVIDECSMVDERMGRDLLSFGCKVLVLGDPAQLPPVGGGGFFTNEEPDYLLTEIHRQALDNPILELATLIREGKKWDSHPLVVSRGEVDNEEAASFDQIICGLNRSRKLVNKIVRHQLGRSGLPVPGEKIVCLRNDYNFDLMNGALYRVEACEEGDEPTHLRLILDNGVSILAHSAPFMGHKVDHWIEREYAMFDFGYALTCHKSQGSQWNNVMVVNESECFKGKERKWLYTAVTRAAETLKVVR